MMNICFNPARRSPWGHFALRTVAGLAALAVWFGLTGGLAARGTAAQPLVDKVGIGGSPCAYATIGLAIAAAADSGDTLYVSPGTYNEVLGEVDKDLHLTAANADCTAADPDAAAFNYAIDGGGAVGGNGGLVNIAANRSVTFTNISLRNAQAINGGLVYVSTGASAAFIRARIEDGQAAIYGGLVYVAPGASLALSDYTGLDQGQAGTAGGGLYSEGRAELVNGVTIQDSHAPSGGGAALAGAGQLILYNSHIGLSVDPNTAAEGGGVHLTGQATLEANSTSTIRWNSATLTHGGGVYASGSVTVTLRGTSRVYGNEAVAYGGGIYADNGAVLIMQDASQVGDKNPLNGNSAVRGGGIYADAAHSVLLQGSAAVRHNSAGDGGGGLYLGGNTPFSMTGGSIDNNSTTGWGGGLAMVNGDAILTGAVISGNTAAEGGGVALDFGGILFQAINTQIISNTASLDGGGIHANADELRLIDTLGVSQLSHNQAGGNGGAIWGTGFMNVNMRAEAPGSQFRVEANTASGNGGGLYVAGDADVYLVGGVWLAGNTALDSGGGLYQSGGSLLVTAGDGDRPHIQHNEALNGNGGGLYVDDISSGLGEASSLLTNATLLGNQADKDGGGLYAINGSYMTLQNVLVHENLAGEDGAGLMASDARLEISQDGDACQNAHLPANHYCSELRGNSASVNGGAVGLELSAEVTISGTAVISNSAGLGSGVMAASNGDRIIIANSLFISNTGKTLYVANDGALNVEHSTLAANGWAIDINDAGASASLENTIIWGNGIGVESEVAIASDCVISQNGVGGAANDPLFQPTGRGDYRLSPASPAVNACLAGLGTDLDSIPRPQGAGFDMGAFESGLPLVLFSALLSVPEGNAGLTPVPFVVALSESGAQTVTLHIETVALSATAGLDFVPISQTLAFPPGVISQTVIVQIVGDTMYEGDETFEVRLSSASGAHLAADTAVITIVDDDSLPAVTIGPGMALEGDSGLTPITLPVTLSNPSAFTVTVEYVTGEGTADAGIDYEPASGTLTFAPGETAAEIIVRVYGDETDEPDEWVGVTLLNPIGAVITPGGGQATATIINDDGLHLLYLPLIQR